MQEPPWSPKRHGLSNSGLDRCPVCDSDLYIFKEGLICMADPKHYNVSHDQYRYDQNLAADKAEESADKAG